MGRRSRTSRGEGFHPVAELRQDVAVLHRFAPFKPLAATVIKRRSGRWAAAVARRQKGRDAGSRDGARRVSLSAAAFMLA